MPIGWRGGGEGVNYWQLCNHLVPMVLRTIRRERERERVTGAVSQRVGNQWQLCILIGQPRACAEVIVSWWLVMGMRIKNNYHLIGQPKSWQLYPDWSARGRRRSSCILIGQPGACVTTIYFWLVENKTDLPWLVNREHAQQQYISDWSKTR